MRLMTALACLALAGCGLAPQVKRSFQIQFPFDIAEAQRQLARGPNTIKGSAFMRQRGGGVVTCAGEIVTLLPSTDYTRERIAAEYGSFERSMGLRRALQFAPDPPEYLTARRQTRCDAQGNFTFDDVADGHFFVETQVAWTVNRIAQGGPLMVAVSVAGGKVAAVVLAE